MARNIRTRIKNFKLSMRMKLTLSLAAIAVALLVSLVISILEYSRMSSYVSELIAGNIHSINVAQSIASTANTYNLEVMAVIGDDERSKYLQLNQEDFLSHCDSLKASLDESPHMEDLADSVEQSFSVYLSKTRELPDIVACDTINTSVWFVEQLQPEYRNLKLKIDNLTDAMYNELKKNSATFERGFYRSIIPGAVAVAVGILLVLLLLFFILAFYVNPIYKMLAGLNNYRSFNKKYNYTFDGDDQLSELNEGITEITEENQQLRKRLKAMRDAMAQKE